MYVLGTSRQNLDSTTVKDYQFLDQRLNTFPDIFPSPLIIEPQAVDHLVEGGRTEIEQAGRAPLYSAAAL